MNNPSPPARGNGPLNVWYHLTSPPEPDASASFQERDMYRRGRTGSQVSIFLFLLIFISFPAAFSGSNSLLIGILAANIFILILALALNRARQVNIAGILVLLSVLASPTANILTNPGGVDASVLPIFGFLVLPVMCAVSFLPPRWGFVVAAVNSVFTLYVLRFLPNSGDLHTVLANAFVSIATPIILSQWIVAIIAFLWVHGAREAIKRADRAELISAMEKQERERQQLEIEQKQQLDAGIKMIIETHAKFANGNYAARAPLNQDNVLWQLAYSLNNLLARVQGYAQTQNQIQTQMQGMQEQIRSLGANNRQLTQELQRTHEAGTRLVQALSEGKSVVPGHSDTIIDEVAAQITQRTNNTNNTNNAPGVSRKL